MEAATKQRLCPTTQARRLAMELTETIGWSFRRCHPSRSILLSVNSSIPFPCPSSSRLRPSGPLRKFRRIRGEPIADWFRVRRSMVSSFSGHMKKIHGSIICSMKDSPLSLTDELPAWQSMTGSTLTEKRPSGCNVAFDQTGSPTDRFCRGRKRILQRPASIERLPSYVGGILP